MNYSGAALLAGKAAYRSGAGLVTLAVPEPLQNALAGNFMEATWLPLPDTQGYIAPEAAVVIQSNYDHVTAMLIGPGLGIENATQGFIGRIFDGRQSNTIPPLVLEELQTLSSPVPLERFIVLFGELSAYRDDMYIATWWAHGVEGHAWEVLDFLSNNDATTFEDLHAKLSRRGVTEEVHAGDVKEFVRRGWAEESSGVVKATEAGKQVRAEVEAETERLFFAPWPCLNESELEELSSLGGQLRDGVRNLKD